MMKNKYIMITLSGLLVAMAILLLLNSRDNQDTIGTISNFDEVVEAIRGLLKKSQQLVLFDDSKRYSVISQYMIFKKADLVIGAHGGGLTNMLWSTRTTRVIEILPVSDSASGRRTRVCYAAMAGSLGLDYTMIPVESVNFDDPINVPVDDLSKAISNA